MLDLKGTTTVKFIDSWIVYDKLLIYKCLSLRFGRHLQSDQKSSHHVIPRDDRGKFDEPGR